MEIMKRRHYSCNVQSELDLTAVCSRLNCSPTTAVRAALRVMARLGAKADLIEPTATWNVGTHMMAIDTEPNDYILVVP